MDDKGYTVIVEGNAISSGYTGDTSTCTTICQPAKAIGHGFCFDCDHPVEIEYDTWWTGDYRAKTCQECGSHDVEFMGRVAKRLWERTQFSQRLEQSLEQYAGISQRLAGL